MTKTTTKQKSQLDKFKQAAREHETDDSEEGFRRVLTKVAVPKRPESKKKASSARNDPR